MKKLKPYLLALFAIPVISFSQNSMKEDELIDWDSTRQLTWTDYKGKPDPNSDAVASTTTFLGIEYNVDADGFTYKIQCKFSKNKSWGLSRTDYILKHEQGHFDIAEIYARKLNKRMSEYRFDKNNYRKDLRKIYEDITKEKEEFQNTYDKETDHSRRKVRQEEWLVKIKDELDALIDYASY